MWSSGPVGIDSACRKHPTARRIVEVFAISVLSFLISLFCSNAAEANAGNLTGQSVSVGIASTFAIADFDGDGHADIASVETGRDDFSAGSYQVLLRLSSSGRRLYQVVAPPGGLLIEARDVNNGNHFVDLVVTTALFKQPVAILINDGSGRFSQVDPTAFPDAFTNSNTRFVSASETAAGGIGAPLQQRSGMCSKGGAASNVHLHADSVSQRSSIFILSTFLISQAGRAPPLKRHNA